MDSIFNILFITVVIGIVILSLNLMKGALFGLINYIRSKKTGYLTERFKEANKKNSQNIASGETPKKSFL